MRKSFLETSLGRDALRLVGMSGDEQLGRPFCWTVEAIADKPLADPAALLGKGAGVQLELPDGGVRHFHGLVTEVADLGARGRYVRYRAQLRPFLWLLTRSTSCRVFQRKSVPEIVKEVCRKHGFGDIELALSDTYAPCEYRVQYNESDFAFVSRLLEQEGIYYFFRHARDKHTLVLCDAPSAHQPSPGFETLRYAANMDDAKGAVLDHWQHERAIQTGTYTLDDYDAERPNTELRVRRSAPRPHAHADLERYEYPGGYVRPAEGERYARIRLEEQQAGYECVIGSGTARGIAAGGTFTLAKHPVASENRAYLVVSARHQLSLDEYDARGGAEEPYRCSFRALPSATPFRPERSTPRPTVPGVQSARVVGPRGDEIWTDKLGSVKVQFAWDREGKNDENSSCFVRVVQSWAGTGFGTQHVPRIGQEVLVGFVDGNPDRPIVIGSAYNGQNAAPFKLPARAAVSGVKTDSTKNAVGYNELSLDDTKGAELVTLHAQRDLTSEVKRNAALTVGGDVASLVKGGVKHEVEGELAGRVKSAAEVRVDGDLTVASKKKLTAQGGTALELSAGTELRLTVGLAQVVLTAAGIIKIKGTALNIDPSCKILLLPVV